MRQLITALFLTSLISLSYGQTDVCASDFLITDFKPLPRPVRKYEHMKKINQKQGYKYWEVIHKIGRVNEKKGYIITRKGDSSKYAALTKNAISATGIFYGCLPGQCMTYIVAVRDSNNIDLITSENDFKAFVGHIDNIEEAMLISEINGYYYRHDTIIAGAYKERKDDYLLYLYKYNNGPVILYSVKAVVTKNGAFRVFETKAYKKYPNRYIIH